MTFPVSSTSVQTAACARFVRVMQRSNAEPLIEHGGVYNCRTVAGSSTYSQHAWGNAIDLFAKQSKDLLAIADNAVLQATKRTKANRGRKLPVHRIIVQDKTWVKGAGWFGYGGVYHTHVHVDFEPNRYGVPPCAT